MEEDAHRKAMLVIDDNSEDGRIRDSNIKLRRNSMEEDARRKARDTGVCRGEGRW
jgi:hypothetical protein